MPCSEASHSVCWIILLSLNCEWKMFAQPEGSTMLSNKNANLILFPKCCSFFFICFDTRFLQGTEPFASFLTFSSLKVFALCWELGHRKVAALSYYWLHSFDAAIFNLPYSISGGQIPLGGGQGCDFCVKLLISIFTAHQCEVGQVCKHILIKK